MGVYINGFPLPNNCGACPLRLAWCRERIYILNRPDRCPLVPVPPHGRLIDADALYARIPDVYPGIHEKNDMMCEITGMDIKKAPTILPADSAEEGE